MNGSTPYNILHLDALYDLLQMVDRSLVEKAIIIADRGYESYNLMAQIQEKGWKFLIIIQHTRLARDDWEKQNTRFALFQTSILARCLDALGAEKYPKSLGPLGIWGLAEKEGFEPSIPFWGIHDFQSCALGQLRDFSMRKLFSQPKYITPWKWFCQVLIFTKSMIFSPRQAGI